MHLLRYLRTLTIATLLAAASATPTLAKDLILERAYFKDELGQRSLKEIKTEAFTPYSNPLNAGFQRTAAYWFRLKIAAANPNEPPYVLRLQPVFHDDIRLFDPADPGSEPRITGDRTPWSAAEFPSLNHSFLLKKTDYERFVYLRLESVHTYVFDAQVLEQNQAANEDWKMLAIYIAYFGLVGMVFLWACTTFFLRPDPVIGTFSAYQFISLFYCTLPFGVARIALDGVIPASVLDFMTILVVIGASFVGMIFNRTLLTQFQLSKWLVWSLNLPLFITAIILGLLLIGETSRALELNATNIFLFAFMALLTVWFGLKSRSDSEAALLPRWTMRFFYTLIFIIILAAVTPLLGLLGTRSPVLHLFLIHNMVSTIVMGSLLFYRARKLADLQTKQLALTKQKADLESQARLQQSQFLDMLNHEIKTPLAVLKLLVAEHPKRVLAEGTIDTITTLLNRCLLSGRLDTDLRIQQTGYSPAEIVKTTIRATGQEPRFEISELTPKTLTGDPELFAVCVANLLDNALKYALPESVIQVSLIEKLQEHPSRVCLTVRNHIGRAGVPELDQVFEKYYRAKSARAIPGTGLGLYLVKSFSTMMGGSVECEIDHQETKTIRFVLCQPC